MADVVFVLGAGCSRACGAPLLNDFLRTAENLFRTDKVQDRADHFRRVFDVIDRLQVVHSKSQLDIRNIETVFSAVDMAKTIGRLPGYDAADIERILTSLRWVIVRTLEESMIYRLDDRNTLVGAGEYESFVSVLQQLIRQHRPSLSVAIITFNYDVALELALLREHIPFNYGIQDEDGQADRKTVRVLKLHGSLNWATTGQKIRVWPISDIATYDGVREYRGSGAPILRIGSEIQKYFAGSVTVDETPALVPPTWNKGAAGSDLAKVWRSAAAELATAEHVYLVGYSIPNTDQFFPYLFALGTAGGKPFRQIAVLDPDANVQQRFRGLLGPGAVASFLPLGSIWFNSVPTQLKGIFGLN